MSKRAEIQYSEKDAATVPAIWRSLEESTRPLSERVELAAREDSVQPNETRSNEPQLIGLGKKNKEAVSSETSSGVGRRQFFAASGVGAAAAFAGCARRPVEQILPYTRAPEFSLPGLELHFASTLSIQGDVTGVLVESHEGRPTKIEGNPSHSFTAPARAGETVRHAGTSLHVQADILNLYDFDRSKFVVKAAGGRRPESDWTEFDEALRTLLGTVGTGAGLHLLVEPTTSPSEARLRTQVAARFPAATIHVWSPSNSIAASQTAADGVTRALPLVAYDAASVVLAIDSDFLGTESGSSRNAMLFARARTVRSPSSTMNRLYAVESTLSITGANADHRLPLASSDIESYLVQLASALGVAGLPHTQGVEVDAKWIAGVAADLRQARQSAVVVAGTRQPARVHALVRLINDSLGSGAVRYYASVERSATSSLQELVGALNSNSVKALVMLGGNPVYSAPADLAFREALAKAETSIHLSSHDNETSALCTWHLPMAHQLESWGDHVAIDGTYSIQQPLIQPFCSGRSAIDILGALAGERSWRAYSQVRQTLQARSAVFNEQTWTTALHSGVTTVREMQVGLSGSNVASLFEGTRAAADGWEVVFALDNKILDGRNANNPWLLELPDPITKLTWDNAALLSPADAAELGVQRDGDLIQVSKGGKSLTIPAFRQPGHARRSITLPLGWGRTLAGQVANGTGFNAYSVQFSDGASFARGYEVTRASGHYDLSVTQEHHKMQPEPLGGFEQPERPLVIETTFAAYRNQPDFAQWREPTPDPEHMAPLWAEEDYSLPRLPAQGGLSWSLFPQRRPAAPNAGPRYKWGLAIDLTSCTGCSACIVACNAENNIATVGKYQIARGREMHWMRLDRYFAGDSANPKVMFQPVACQQCEEAPCENVCPVNATAHSPEGLNDMAYNRCVGTRYCMNNCPYKVRRFNFLAYQGHPTEFQRMQFNPNVSVRMRGVMEKCTYCVQRIQAARIQSKNEYRRIREGEIKTACQEACPSRAIVFGDLNDSQSEVSQLTALDRNYKLLANVGTQPRTVYLGKLRNINPEMV